MNVSDFDLKECRQDPAKVSTPEPERNDDLQDYETGLLDGINASPIGRLLKIIGSLPEVRQERVFELRSKIDHEQYDMNNNLDVALDRVIEELIAEG